MGLQGVVRGATMGDTLDGQPSGDEEAR